MKRIILFIPFALAGINKDFRYQLTVIGTFAQAIIGEKISGNKFTIKTSIPNVEVSWQVTGVRHDAFSNSHPMVPVVEKESYNKGKYLNPADYGKPETTMIGYEVSKPAKPQMTKTTVAANHGQKTEASHLVTHQGAEAQK